jgi:hypothetical protein
MTNRVEGTARKSGNFRKGLRLTQCRGPHLNRKRTAIEAVAEVVDFKKRGNSHAKRKNPVQSFAK